MNMKCRYLGWTIASYLALGIFIVFAVLTVVAAIKWGTQQVVVSAMVTFGSFIVYDSFCVSAQKASKRWFDHKQRDRYKPFIPLLVFLLPCIGCSKVRPSEPERLPARPAEKAEVYVKVPFQQAVDEVLYQEAVAGNLPLSERFAVKEGRLVTISALNTMTAPVPHLLCGQFVFGCRSDNKGSYFVPDDLYQKIKGQLIHNRQGTIHYFPLNKPAIIKGVLDFPDMKDAGAWEVYIWDEVGKVWRYPVTLRVVERTHRIRIDNQLLYGIRISPRKVNSLLHELSSQHDRWIRDWRIEKSRRNP